MPAGSLAGRIAVVTGAGRGLGRGSALALAELGADVAGLSRSRDELESLAAEVETLGRRAWVLPADVTDRDALESALAEPPRIDILVCAAGGNIPEPFVDVPDEHLDRILALNVKGTFLPAQIAARRMIDAGEGGVIITLSSQMGHVGAVGRTVYCATKHAVEGLTKAMALELAPHDIRVVAVAPTFIETPLTKPILADPDFRREVEASIPLHGIGEVEDVSGVVAFLATRAARLMTGTSVVVDGGWTAR